ncbi:CG10467 [Drosophila busckii]|uniref:Aldose 1-epimerase n=1 Tax=Drosophila busckii TaxID=30019 RepID=A0A0M4EK74_DROBS|nr:CG10467 [Drosophila busckii]
MVYVKEDVFAEEALNPFTKQTEKIRRFTLSNDEQMSVQIITLGATITSIKVPDAHGKLEDVTLGFDDLAGYDSELNPYMGATVGRVCNRLQLHGGFVGFNNAHWQVLEVHQDGVSLSHINPDGHEGYPGEVTATVRFTLTEDNCLHVRMEALTTKPTPINFTNHSYFNLAGHDSGKTGLYEHTIQLNAYGITETDDNSIPTGKILPLDGTNFDLRLPSKLGDRLKQLQPALGYDDNFCVQFTPPERVTTIARVSHAPSGRWLEIASNQPGVQLYTSNFLPDVERGEKAVSGKAGAAYAKHGAFCLETQKFPDSVNHENFPSTIVRPNDKYHHEVIYNFGRQQ